jgi:chromosome segregation ATPase
MLVAGSEDLEKIDEMVHQMAQTQHQIDTANRAAEGLTRQLGEQEVRFRGQLHVAEQQLGQVRGENERLGGLQQGWAAERTRLEAQNRDLEAVRAGLADQVARLSESQAGFKQHLQQLLQHNLELGRHAGVFKQAGGDLSDKEKALRGAIESLDGRFDEDFAQLSGQIQSGRQVAAEVMGMVQSQAGELDNLRKTADRVAKVEAGLATEVAKVKQEWIQLQKTKEGLEATQKSLAAAEARIHNQNLALQVSKAELEKYANELAKDVAKQQAELGRLNQAIANRT